MAKYAFDLKSGIIPVNVELYGKRIITIRMALDTGATFTIISWDAAELLGFTHALPSFQTKIITASGSEIVKSFRINKAKALGKEVRNLRVLCHDLPPESTVDGLLGLDFLGKFDFFVSFKKGYVELR